MQAPDLLSIRQGAFHNRSFVATIDDNGKIKEIEFHVNYNGAGNADKGFLLDSVIIPAIKQALVDAGITK